jgi:IS30 family transposase
MLVHLPNGYKAEEVRDALTEKIQTIPDIIRASLTWDQGPEMRDWKTSVSPPIIDIYFCDPHAPWQRGTSENTNGLLRSPRPPTSPSTAPSTSTGSPPNSMTDPANKRLGFAKPIEEIGPVPR